ncbi:uncharacterized protein LOC110030602 [Phalaenopsis equestris]|uniref:uncharacterized protein LOC110030602 n=1 Tax=Phalaenopsis equestris TaxID=78828 RepID=UPI0009E5D903|nr:uncharacterized protein LOC110030602 [Phalaenopsis equestris]
MDFQEAIQSKKWKDGMDEEIKAIEKNDTWELASLPKGHKAIDVKWVYKAKKNSKGEVERYKIYEKSWSLMQLHAPQISSTYTQVSDPVVAQNIYIDSSQEEMEEDVEDEVHN